MRNWRVLILIITSLALALPVAAQDSSATGWKTSLTTDFTTTQTAYSDSWVGGEAGSFSWVSNLQGSARKQLVEWFDFQSTLKMSFGQTMTQNEDKDWEKPKKSTDLIDWENVGCFTVHGYVDPFAAFRVESQFLDASVNAKKRYLSPLKLTESAGISRRFYEKDEDQVFSRLGLALRQIITKNIIDSAVLNTETETVTDGGLESVTDVVLTINERLQYTGKLTLFKALFFSEKDDVEGTEYENDWKAVDINWENIVNASITKIISVNFYTQVLYDKQVSRKTRFKETLGIGFVFKLI